MLLNRLIRTHLLIIFTLWYGYAIDLFLRLINQDMVLKLKHRLNHLQNQVSHLDI